MADRSVPARRYSAFLSYSRSADRRLAPALRLALQRFAKAWYRPRAVRVFLDDESLSAAPGLWSSIQAALDDSEYFILLASPEAAASAWVDREVRYWLAHRPVRTLLFAVSGGDLRWDPVAGQFDPDATTALPPALLDAYAEEPRWVDLRAVRTAGQLSLDVPQWRRRWRTWPRRCTGSARTT